MIGTVIATSRSSQPLLTHPHRLVSQNSKMAQSDAVLQGKRSAGTPAREVVTGASVVVGSAVRVMKDVISVVKSRFWVVSRVVVKSSSVTKDVSIEVSADVNAAVVSRVVVSSAVIADVSVSNEV